MSNYISPGTVFPNYYQFPQFLLRAPISQTAKLTYMVLYDRARLSKKNEWNINGKIYTVYPIAELAETLGKSESTIKSVLNELDDNGLLTRRSGGFSKANILYVLLPDTGQFSDEMTKSYSKSRKKKACRGENSGRTTGSLSAPSNVIETNNNNQTTGVNQRTAFGRYKNIFLLESEYDQLCRDFPGRMDRLIEEMSSYCEANGKAYRNCEAALRSWAAKEAKEGSKKGSGFPDYSYEEGESF